MLPHTSVTEFTIDIEIELQIAYDRQAGVLTFQMKRKVEEITNKNQTYNHPN